MLALMVTSTSAVMVQIPVLLLVTLETNMALANSLRIAVNDVLSLPSSKEAIADRCLELAETKRSERPRLFKS